MLISEKVKDLMEKFENISVMLYQGGGRGIVEIKNELEDAVKLINIFRGIIPQLNNMGLDIPQEVIAAQIKNLEDGLYYKDFFMIADTLKYEINDTLLVINDLVSEGVIRDEKLF